MARRSVCLCEGKLVPIESIFTVRDGKQINIPERVEWLRGKSKMGELFCDCGCGANLILVAGDRGLREQHFRMKSGTEKESCSAIAETDESILSKIVLKCWLDDKLSESEIQARVPLTQLDPKARKFELTFYDRILKLAVCFWNDRNNISSEKIMAVDSCPEIHSKIFFTAWENTGGKIQYPEFLMKIQRIQGYNLFLKLVGDDKMSAYQNAVLEVKVQVQDRNGLWKELPVLATKLSRFELSDEGTLIFANKPVERFVKEVSERFHMEEERTKKQEEARMQAAEEAIKREQERKQREREREEQERTKRNLELERKLQELRAALKQDAENKSEAKEDILTKEETSHEIPIERRDFEHEKMPVLDSDGKRWVKCRFCGSIGLTSEFCDIGYPSPGLGKCNACNRKGVVSPEVARLMQKDEKEQKTSPIYYCKQCGAKLVKRSGPYGYYWGCSRYPYCRYTTKKLTE